MANALALFRSSRFLPIFLTQFGGALNDNLFKSAMLILVAFQLTDAAEQASTINNLAALLFILPYFLLSPLAGQLADRGRKARMIQNNKIAEICIALATGYALYSQSIPLMLFVLCSLGAQSAMFGPNKYAILPQLMQGKSLITGNALIASGTFVAILLGTLLGSILAQQASAWIWIGAACFITAVAGFIAARQIPETDIGEPDLKIQWNPYKQIRVLWGLARNDTRIWIAILGVSWFWFTGVAYLTQIPTLVRYVGAGNESVVTLFLALFIAGIGLGCGLSAKLSSDRAEIGFSAIALILLGVVGFDLSMKQVLTTDALLNLGQFIQQPRGIHISIDIFLIGLFGGCFVLPLYTELQQLTRVENRARIISLNNVLNAIFMVLSSVIAVVVLGVLKLGLPTYLGLVAVLNICFAIYLYFKLTAGTLRFIAQVASNLLYKIDTKDLDRIPSEGAALLICNHVSYADSIIIFGSCKRPIRFLMYKDIRDIKGLNFFFEGARTLGICSPLKDRAAYEHAMGEAIESLKNDELVFIFPEGHLSKDGEIAAFQRGIEKLLEGQPVPVIPMALTGLWGSFFSHGGGPALKSGAKLRFFRRPVQLLVGEQIEPEIANVKLLRTRVAELRGDLK